MKIKTFNRISELMKYNFFIAGFLLCVIVITLCIYDLALARIELELNIENKNLLVNEIKKNDFINIYKNSIYDDYKIFITYYNKKQIEFYIYDGIEKVATFNNFEEVKSFFKNN